MSGQVDFDAILPDVPVNGQAKPRKAEPAPGRTVYFRDGAHHSDTGNAQRVIHRHGADLRFNHPWRYWLVWDGARWAMDDTAEATRRVKETQAAIYRAAVAELQKLGDDNPMDPERRARFKELNAILAHCLRWESDKSIAACLNQMKSEPGVPVLPAQLDADPWALNVGNCTLDLRTGNPRDHRREDMLTKLCPVEHNPAATCPRWLAFLDWAMQGRKTLVDYLQRVVGYCLTADVSEQSLWFLHGAGSNGKSTFILTLLEMLGDYSSQAVSELLLQKSHDTHPTERADLMGRRLVATIETDEGKRLAESLMKQLTGSDRVKARRMRQDFFEMTPTWKLFLVANHRPVVRGQDLATWRRIKLVPFEATIADADKDPHLSEKLKAELPGILNWALAGCMAWQREGLCEPAEVKAATAAYQAEQDLLGGFLAECCTLIPEARCQAATLHEAYQDWSADRLTNQRAFRQRLEDKGYQCAKSTGGRMFWHGIGLPAKAEENGGDEG
ncbi:hypothetical protein AYO44_03770 [Planctomycetaceae bacterium SCGC AG-212-F19]|nr:hypothetical protein AYO44_03770 [Planctomycetaceae bacterium SCGC AG-212-F19]